jgi:hypothetical protein
MVAAVLLVLIPASAAFAAYAYDYGRTSDLRYADECVSYASDAWVELGFSYQDYLGSSFTRSSFLANCPYGNGVYAYTHGSTTTISDNGSGTITTSDVSVSRKGDWKRLVFLDACNTATSSEWAAAWGIRTGDGDLHAFIGWVGFSYDSPLYADFTYCFFKNMSYYRYTIRRSLELAKAVTGISNYRYYGNADWAY